MTIGQTTLFSVEEEKAIQQEDKEYKLNKDATKTVYIGQHRSAQVNFRKVRMAAIKELKEVLAALEGQNVGVSTYDDFWWTGSLLLRHLHTKYLDGWGHNEQIHTVVLWGSKGKQHIRMFLDRLWNVRTQYMWDGKNQSSDGGKPYYLVDFWNGFDHPIDQYKRTGYQSLHFEVMR